MPDIVVPAVEFNNIRYADMQQTTPQRMSCILFSTGKLFVATYFLGYVSVLRNSRSSGRRGSHS